jgi:hypothetical protein
MALAGEENEVTWLRGFERYKLHWPIRDEPVETVLVERR